MDSVGVREAATARLESPEEALEQVLQEREHDMAETDEVLSDIRMGCWLVRRREERSWLTSM